MQGTLQVRLLHTSLEHQPHIFQLSVILTIITNNYLHILEQLLPHQHIVEDESRTPNVAVVRIGLLLLVVD
jgi:hypothetical protein